MCLTAGTTSVALYGKDTNAAFGSNHGTLGSPVSEVENRMVPVGGPWLAPANLPATGEHAAFTLNCVNAVDITIDKTGPATEVVGGTNQYVLTISNPSATPYSVSVSDSITAGVTFTGVVSVPVSTPPCTFGPSSVSCADIVVPAMGDATVTIDATFTACTSKTNTAGIALLPGQGAIDPTNNSDVFMTSVTCPTLTKTASSSTATTGENVDFTLTASGYEPGSSVTITDVIPAGTSVVPPLPAGCVEGPPGTVVCTGAADAGGTYSVTITLEMPASAGTVCNQFTATGTTSPSNQACVTVLPAANGIVKDLDPSDPDFDNVGNLWICKGAGFPTPFAGPDSDLPDAQANCNQLELAELLFFSPDIDTCNDDNDGDGDPCADEDGSGPGCDLNAENYIPGVTSIDCDGGEVAEGLGAFEFQIKYDHKMFQQPVIDCNGILGSTGRAVQSAVQVVTENWTLFGCVTKNGVGGGLSGSSVPVPSNQGGTCVTTYDGNPAPPNPGFILCSNVTGQWTGSLNSLPGGWTQESRIDLAPLFAGVGPAPVTGTFNLDLGGGNTLTGTSAGILFPGPGVNQNTIVSTITITGSAGNCAGANGQQIQTTVIATGSPAAALAGTYGSITFWPVGLCGAPLLGGVISPNGLAATVTLTIQPDLFQRIRPTKDNGVVTDLLDENCEIADIFGMPFEGSVQGGLTPDCGDATVTIRMLEGDVDLNCEVDVADDQAMAFRYGSFFGNLLYNKFFDLEPNIAPDFDIDIKDLQTVFGRNGSTCDAPIPDQDPNPQIPDP
jgi:uncharacterized repeat protein (TIGR01451 family)